MARTASVWGQPRAEFYRLMARLEGSNDISKPFHAVVLGCADGRYVLPMARRGHRVLAIDIEREWLIGNPSTVRNTKRDILGLKKRLETEGLADLVTIQHADFIDYLPPHEFDLVFLNGSIQYPCNAQRSRQEIFDGIKKYTRLSGYLFADFMLPMSPAQERRANFPNMMNWTMAFNTDGWRVVYSRKMKPFIDQPHHGMPFPHMHQKGYLLAQRLG